MQEAQTANRVLWKIFQEPSRHTVQIWKNQIQAETNINNEKMIWCKISCSSWILGKCCTDPRECGGYAHCCESDSRHCIRSRLGQVAFVIRHTEHIQVFGVLSTVEHFVAKLPDARAALLSHALYRYAFLICAPEFTTLHVFRQSQKRIEPTTRQIHIPIYHIR